jgi:hypothetical protein
MVTSQDPTDPVKDIQTSMAFITGFANGLIKLKHAKDTSTTATLTAQEAKAVIEGLQLLRKGPLDA